MNQPERIDNTTQWLSTDEATRITLWQAVVTQYPSLRGVEIMDYCLPYSESNVDALNIHQLLLSQQMGLAGNILARNKVGSFAVLSYAIHEPNNQKLGLVYTGFSSQETLDIIARSIENVNDMIRGVGGTKFIANYPGTTL